MALATHACGAEAEAVRISRLVGLVCCECHIAMFFFASYLEPWFFFFTLTTMFQNFLDTQHRTAPRGLFRFCCERCGSKVFANNQLQLTRPPQAGERAKVLESCKKAAGGGRCALPPKGNVIRQTTKNGFKGARSACRRLSFSFPFLSWPCLVFAMALATHACGGETQAVRISRPVGLVCFECHVAIVFFAIYLEPWFFFFTLTRFHPNNFSEYFRQTTKNGSKGAFSVLSPFVVFVLFLSSSFLVLRWLWPRMLVVPKPKLFVFLGLLAWFAVSVTLRCFFLQFTWNHGFSFSR